MFFQLLFGATGEESAPGTLDPLSVLTTRREYCVPQTPNSGSFAVSSENFTPATLNSSLGQSFSLMSPGADEQGGFHTPAKALFQDPPAQAVQIIEKPTQEEYRVRYRWSYLDEQQKRQCKESYTRMARKFRNHTKAIKDAIHHASDKDLKRYARKLKDLSKNIIYHASREHLQRYAKELETIFEGRDSKNEMIRAIVQCLKRPEQNSVLLSHSALHHNNFSRDEWRNINEDIRICMRWRSQVFHVGIPK